MTESSYLQYLPAILQQGDFLGRFLLAFETVLSGVKDPQQLPEGQRNLLGLEQLLDRFPELFNPQTLLTQEEEEFLPWLSQWVATSLRDDWSTETRRKFISQIVPLYNKRGTRAGIEAVLRLSGDDVVVVDFNDGTAEDEVKKQFPGEKPPHFFGIVLTVKQSDPVLLARTVRRVRAIADREKPAHAVYALLIQSPTMRINDDPSKRPEFGPGIRVGVNSALGTQKL